MDGPRGSSDSGGGPGAAGPVPHERVPTRSGLRLPALANPVRWRALVPPATVAVVAFAAEFAARTVARRVLTRVARALASRQVAAVASGPAASAAGRARHFTRTVITEITVIERVRRRR